MSNPTSLKEEPPLITADGVPLSYYRIGQGPGLIILHGSISSAYSSFDLANALADTYTVYIPSRRGRGNSGPFPPPITDATVILTDPPTGLEGKEDSAFHPSYDHDFASAILHTEISDLAALVKKTKATYLLSISSGAIVALAALMKTSSTPSSAIAADLSSLSGIQKVIIFEPPVFFTDTPASPTDSSGLHDLRRCENELAQGDTASALVTAMKIVQLGPAWFRALPRFITRFMTQLMINHESKPNVAEVGDLGVVTMRDLATTMRYDFAVCELLVGPSKKFAGVGGDREVLLLGGDQSPEYMVRGLRVLEGVMKGARRVEMQGVGHEVMSNRDRRGNPERATVEIKKFFGGEVTR